MNFEYIDTNIVCQLMKYTLEVLIEKLNPHALNNIVHRTGQITVSYCTLEVVAELEPV